MGFLGYFNNFWTTAYLGDRAWDGGSGACKLPRQFHQQPHQLHQGQESRLGRYKVFALQGDQLYMAVCFWYLFKSDLSSNSVYSSLHLALHFL